MSAITRAEAFLAREHWTVDELQAWYPELQELHHRLYGLWAHRAFQTHSNPDKQLAALLRGLQALLTRAEMIGVWDEANEQLTFEPLPR